MNDLVAVERLAEDISIASRAMKAVFHRGIGAARRSRDAAAEEAVKRQFGDEGQIVTRKLFSGKHNLIYRRGVLAGEMYAYHMHCTLPHDDEGSRLLPNAMYFEYTLKMQDYEMRLQQMDAQIVATYDQLVQADIAERNAALMGQGKQASAGAADYPNAEQIGRYLYVDWRLEPISTANDFRYQVDESVKARMEQALQRTEQAAKVGVFERLLGPIKAFADKLDVYSGDKGQRFSESFITNIKEMAETLPAFNFDNDPRVAEIVEEVKKAITPYAFNPTALKEVPEVRQLAKEKMKGLIDKFKDYGVVV